MVRICSLLCWTEEGTLLDSHGQVQHKTTYRHLAKEVNVIWSVYGGLRHAKCQKVYTGRIFKGKILPQKRVNFNTRQIATKHRKFIQGNHILIWVIIPCLILPWVTLPRVTLPGYLYLPRLNLPWVTLSFPWVIIP